MVELVWDGKYKDGKKVAPVRIALPFQDIETVNESAQERQKMLDFFSAGKDSEWRNRLIWGDKKYVLPSLLDEFAGKVNLIYIDPPFATGADFSFTAQVPDDPDAEGDQSSTFVKEPSILEQKAYRDTWGRGLDSFLQWFYETAILLRELLAEDGSIYVHLDWHVAHYAKVVLDEIFGQDNFNNDVIWYYRRWTAPSKYFQRYHDTILWYSRGPNWVFTSPREQPANVLKGRRESYERDEDGRLFRWQTANGKRYKIYRNEEGVLMGDVWELPFLHPSAHERLEYATQKPEALLERIIRASSNEGDLVLDCFCGSGTTAAVAEKLGRRWITCDLGRFAIHTTRKRLLSITPQNPAGIKPIESFTGVTPFVVQNLGKYERQAWQAAEFDTPEGAQLREVRYRRFILELYKAEPINSGAWLHGVKLGRMVHVGPVDAPVTLSDVKAIARETWQRVGTGEDAPERAGVDILGWEFAFELNELGKQVAEDAGVDVKFKKIPREVLEKKAVDQGDIRFFELAALSVDVTTKGKTVGLELKDFIISPDDVPQDVMREVTHWSQWVDYWAIDWDFKGDTFHNQWQSYRTKKSPKLELKASHTYDAPGTYTVLVKVIDLLGNDTTKALEVRVG